MWMRMSGFAALGIFVGCGSPRSGSGRVEAIDAGSTRIAAEPVDEPTPEPASGEPHTTVGCVMQAATILHIQDPDGGYLHWGADPSKHVRFDRGSAEIPPENDERLLFLVELARSRPPPAFTVEGHRRSDERRKLDEQRAEAVRERLISLGADPGWITTTSYDDTRPIANPKSKEGQEANARVDIHLDLTWPPIPEEWIRQACPPEPDAD